MIRNTLIFIIFILLGFAGFMFYHLGALKPVQIVKQTNRPAMFMLYKDFMGPYHKTVTVIEEVEKWAKSQKIDCSLSFGQYLDEPEGMEEARLRSYGGCIIKNEKQLNLEDLRLSLGAIPPSFRLIETPMADYVVATFEGSPGIGPIKVYPKVFDFMKEQNVTQNGPVTEVYEILNEKEIRAMKTTYLFPIFNSKK